MAARRGSSLSFSFSGATAASFWTRWRQPAASSQPLEVRSIKVASFASHWRQNALINAWRRRLCCQSFLRPKRSQKEIRRNLTDLFWPPRNNNNKNVVVAQFLVSPSWRASEQIGKRRGFGDLFRQQQASLKQQFEFTRLPLRKLTRMSLRKPLKLLELPLVVQVGCCAFSLRSRSLASAASAASAAAAAAATAAAVQNPQQAADSNRRLYGRKQI